MVEVVWVSGQIEDIQTSHLESFFARYLLNKFRKEEKLDNWVGYPLESIRDKNLSKDVPEANFKKFVNIYKKAFDAVGKKDIGELAKDYMPEPRNKKEKILMNDLRLEKDYPKVLVKEAHLPKSVAEFSGYSTSLNYPRDDDYPEDYEEDKRKGADKDKPEKFGQMQEMLIHDEYIMTKRDFNECYDIDIKTLDFIRNKDGNIVSETVNKDGEITSTKCEIEVVLSLEPDKEWNMKFYRKNNLMPQLQEKGSEAPLQEKTTSGSALKPTPKVRTKILDEEGKETGEYREQDYFGNNMTAQQRIDYMKRAKLSQEEEDEQRIHNIPGGRAFKKELRIFERSHRSDYDGKSNPKSSDEILSMFGKLIDKMDIFKALKRNSIMKSPKYITEGEVILTFKSTQQKMRPETIVNVQVIPKVDKVIILRPYHKKIDLWATKSKMPKQTLADAGFGEKGKAGHYAPVSKMRELLIKSVKVRYQDLDRIYQNLKKQVGEANE